MSAAVESVINDVKCDSYLVLKLLRPLAVSRSRGKVARPFVVILVHCMKRVTAVVGWGGQTGRGRRREKKEGKTDRE